MGLYATIAAMTKVSFFTLGCRANQAETAVLEDLLREKGFIITHQDSPSDIAVINSCTVTGEAERATLKTMGRACRLNPGVRIAIIGCLAQVQKEKLLSRRNVRWVVGTARKMCLADILREEIPDAGRVVVPSIQRAPFTMPLTASFGRRTRANLKIQDGCDNACAYCEVPFARGRARSRVFADVMAEAGALVDAGYQEVILTGINLGAYAHEGMTLVPLVRQMEKIKGLARIRISSLEYAPWIGALAKLMQAPHKLCRFLHVPVQSGCDRTLARMGRLYTSRDVGVLMEQFVRKVPGVMLGTDVIVGFPGESESDFEQTCSFLDRSPFHYFHVFSYSDRQRARSRSFKGVVPAEVIRARSLRLRALGHKKRQAFLQSSLGSVGEAIFEQKKGRYWVGHLDNYVTIKILSDQNIRNRMIRVKLLKLEDGFVIGREDEGWTH